MLKRLFKKTAYRIVAAASILAIISTMLVSQFMPARDISIQVGGLLAFEAKVGLSVNKAAATITSLGTAAAKEAAATVTGLTWAVGDTIVACVSAAQSLSENSVSVYPSGSGTFEGRSFMRVAAEADNSTNADTIIYETTMGVAATGSGEVQIGSVVPPSVLSVYKLTGMATRTLPDNTTNDSSYKLSSNTGTHEQTVAQAFNFLQAADLEGIELSLRKSGSPTGTLTVQLMEQDGGEAGGTLIDTFGTLDVSTLTTGYQWIDFPDTVTLSADSMVWLQVVYSGGDLTNYVELAKSNTLTGQVYPYGFVRTLGGSWGYSISDAINWRNFTGAIDGGCEDKSSSATGSSTSASSGATATLAQAAEVIIGAIGVEDEVDDLSGTWTTGAGYVSGNEQQTGTNGAGDASNNSIYSAAEIVSATTAQEAEVTGIDSADWSAAVATLLVGVTAADISNTPTSKAFSVVAASTTYWSDGAEPSWPLVDADAFFTLTNNGATCSVTVVSTNFTGGVGWTLTSGAPGTNTVRLTVFEEGDGSGAGLILTTSPQAFISALTTNVDWELKMETPSTMTDGTVKTATITLAATLD